MKNLNWPLMVFVIEADFLELTVGITVDDFTPKCLGGKVFRDFVYLPRSRKLIEHIPGCKFTDALFSVLFQHKKFGDEVDFFRRFVQTGGLQANEDKPGDLIIHADEKRAAIGIFPKFG